MTIHSQSFLYQRKINRGGGRYNKYICREGGRERRSKRKEREGGKEKRKEGEKKGRVLSATVSETQTNKKTMK